jgi:hypothetical protein
LPVRGELAIKNSGDNYMGLPEQIAPLNNIRGKESAKKERIIEICINVLLWRTNV